MIAPTNPPADGAAVPMAAPARTGIKPAVAIGAVVVFALGIGAGALVFAGGDDDDDPFDVAATAPTTVPVTETSAPTETTATVTTTTTTAVLPQYATCQNTLRDWTLEYPADWYTDDGGEPELTCTMFDPEPFEVELDTEPYFVGVFATWAANDYDEMVASTMEGTFATVLDRQDVQIDGRRATAFLLEETGEGFFDAGWMRYEYHVEWGPASSFLITLSNPPGAFFEETRPVIDTMARSLRLGAPPA